MRYSWVLEEGESGGERYLERILAIDRGAENSSWRTVVKWLREAQRAREAGQEKKSDRLQRQAQAFIRDMRTLKPESEQWLELKKRALELSKPVKEE